MTQTSNNPPSFNVNDTRTTVFAAVLAAARRYGAKTPILEDAETPPMSYGRLILGALILGRRLCGFTRRGENVGVLLPNVAGMAVTLIGLNAFGRVGALLNFTAGVRNILSAADTAPIETVVTSRRFVSMAGLEEIVAALAASRTPDGKARRIVYLEDVRKSIGTWDKLRGLADARLASGLHRRHGLGPDAPAVVLFTSGTEGSPKAVVLSNQNLVANAHQIFAHAAGASAPGARMLNPLPMFHSCGLTAGTLMPLICGLSVVLYPSPLHYKQIPKLIRERKPTVMVATDTFLQGYAKAADPGDLDSLRLVVAGAERVKDTTRNLWSQTGATLLEGYGATECSPVIACNVPGTNTSGTVGAPLPGIELKVEPVDGIETGGKLSVRGPNVMLGYIYADRPGVRVPLPGGWHDTGDIVVGDAAGMITIKGRAKRFAKIGGEMVSLAAVETMIGEIWPDDCHVIVSRSDERKGEQLILVTDRKSADRSELLSGARARGFTELWLPRRIVTVDTIPLLGSGKIDFPATGRLLDAMTPQSSRAET